MLPFLKSLLGYRALPRMLAFLFVSAIYLYAFPQANVIYAIVVLLHAGIGLLTSVYLVIFFFRILRGASIQARIGWLLVAISAVLGLILVKTGTSRPEWKLVYLHIAGAIAGSAILFAEWAGRKGWLAPGFAKAALRYAVCLLALVGLG